MESLKLQTTNHIMGNTQIALTKKLKARPWLEINDNLTSDVVRNTGREWKADIISIREVIK